MELTVTTRTPLHIGDGTLITRLDGVQEPNRLQVFDERKFEALLEQYGADDFGMWIEAGLEGSDRKLDIRDYFKQNARLKTHYREAIAYSLPVCGSLALPASRFIKTNGLPYVSGSEIKGALRSTVIFAALDASFHKEFETNFEKEAERNLDGLLSMLAEFGRNRHNESQIDQVRDKRTNPPMRYAKSRLVKEVKKITREMQTWLFHSGNQDDPKFDLFKHILISDALPQPPESCLYAADVRVLGIEAPNSGHELCRPEITWSGMKLINGHNYDRRLHGKKYTRLQRWWLEDNGESPNLFATAYWFSKRLLEAEKNFFQDSKTPVAQDLSRTIDRLMQLNKPSSPLLRIGKHQGYLSLTLAILVREAWPELYENVLCHATKNTSYSWLFPKTRRVTTSFAQGLNSSVPLGWVQLAKAG